MSRFYGTLIACCFGMTAMAQNAAVPAPKLSPLTRVLLRDLEKTPAGSIPDGYIHKQYGNGTIYVTGLVKVANATAVKDKMEALGVITGTKAGDIWTVQVPVVKVKEFTQLAGLSYIQLDEPLKPAMDVVRKTTRTDSVHKGYSLPYPFTGKDVVLGIIDFGFDYGHPTLFDTTGINYRVKKVWELNGTGTPPSGYTYGRELNGAIDIQAHNTDNTEQTHGTAVAGVAAGSGMGTSGKLKGIAFDADMVFVGVRRDAIGNQWRQSSFTDFLDGVNYIFNYAASVSKPAVVNISWGSQSGPHDGTSLFNQACDNLSGQGKVIVMSAGNEGQEKIHLSKTFTPTDSLINTFATFSSPAYKRTWIDIWGDTAKTFCAKVTLYKNGVAGNTTGMMCINNQTNSTYILGQNGLDTCFIDFISSSSEFNNKPRMTLNIFNKAADSIHISVKGTDGSIDMWNEYYYYGYTYGYSSAFESLGLPGAVSGNTASTVSDMGSAKSVLLVGAYASKTGWRDISGTSWSYSSATAGALVGFSSRGPMADGRIKPDITAPGLTLATATSSYDLRYTPTGLNKQQVVSSYVLGGKTYYYAEFSGTSASSPAAAGIVALMLQANPRLTPQQVHDMVVQNAIKDNFTGTIPPGGNNDWGNGKINAFASVKAALQANSIYSFEGKTLDCALFPNPNNGLFTLSFTGNKKEVLHIETYNIAGMRVYETNWTVCKGEQAHELNLSQLAKGTYLVKISSAEGTVSIKTLIQ